MNQFKLEDKEKTIAATLHCYASGDGSLSFVYQNLDGKATGDAVSRRDVEAFVRERRPDLSGWVILNLYGQFKLFEAVTRTAPDEVQYKGLSFRYAKLHEQSFEIFDNDNRPINNFNIKGAIMFYVNHERECDDAMRGN